MLNIGTKVFIKNLHKEDRPETQQQCRRGLRFIKCEYGYIVDCADNGYYLVAHEDNMNYHEGEAREYGVYIHEDEMVNMDTYKPKFKIGDKVRICEPTEHDRKHYLVGWMYDMRVYRASCNHRIMFKSSKLLQGERKYMGVGRREPRTSV